MPPIAATATILTHRISGLGGVNAKVGDRAGIVVTKHQEAQIVDRVGKINNKAKIGIEGGMNAVPADQAIGCRIVEP